MMELLEKFGVDFAMAAIVTFVFIWNLKFHRTAAKDDRDDYRKIMEDVVDTHKKALEKVCKGLTEVREGQIKCQSAVHKIGIEMEQNGL
jgi:hypothetical protein